MMVRHVGTAHGAEGEEPSRLDGVMRVGYFEEGT